MPITRRRFLTLLPLIGLGGCGFRLRGAQGWQLPYASIFIALPETSDIRIWLERYIRTTRSTEIKEAAKEAEAIFQQLNDNRQKTILSVNAQGRVREYRLELIYSFQVVDRQGRILIPPSDVMLTRDITYNDSSVLAKDQEEGLLWRDMNNDLVSQIMRRLAIMKPKNPDLADRD